mgnify:CR=1 FL=1
MSLRDAITVMVLTHNEEANIGRTLEAVRWADRILLVDSGSTDRTLIIAATYAQVRIVQRRFDSFAAQCNFGLDNIMTPWVLSLDADYVLTDEISHEIEHLSPPEQVSGYRARFIYRVRGKALRSTVYPPRTVLYRRQRARYRNEGHAHRVMLDGEVRRLGGRIFHDDRKPLSRWLESQQRYARSEADHLLATPRSALGPMDRIRRMGWLAPIGVLPFALILKGGLLDGRAGLLYAFQRQLAETMIAIEIMDRRLRRRTPDDGAPSND